MFLLAAWRQLFAYILGLLGITTKRLYGPSLNALRLGANSEKLVNRRGFGLLSSSLSNNLTYSASHAAAAITLTPD